MTRPMPNNTLFHRFSPFSTFLEHATVVRPLYIMKYYEYH